MRTGRAGRGVLPGAGAAGGAAHSARSTCPAKSPLRGTNDTVPGAGVNSPGAAARSRCGVAEIVQPLDDLGVAQGQSDAQRERPGIDPRNHPDTFAGEPGLDHQRQPAVVVAGDARRARRSAARSPPSTGGSIAGGAATTSPSREARSSAWPCVSLPAVESSRSRLSRSAAWPRPRAAVRASDAEHPVMPGVDGQHVEQPIDGRRRRSGSTATRCPARAPAARRWGTAGSACG